MTQPSIEIPCLDPVLVEELNRIHNQVSLFISAVESKKSNESGLEDRLSKIPDFPQEITTDLIEGKLTKGAAFSRFLSDYLLKIEKVEELTERWANAERVAEGILLDFVENYLIRHFMVDSDGRTVDYNYFFKVEGRCPREECNGYVDQMVWEVDRPVLEQDFYYGSKMYIPPCDKSRKGDFHLTEPISSVNMVLPKDPKSTYIYGIHSRLKSAGRLLDKLVDYIRGEHGGINDIAAARIVVNDKDNAKRNKRIIVDTILKSIRGSYQLKRGQSWDNRIEYRNVDTELNPSNISGDKCPTKRVPKFVEVIVPVNGIEIGLQIQTFQWYSEMEESRELRHIRYVERKEKERREKWDDYNYALRTHLEPIFSTH